MTEHPPKPCPKCGGMMVMVYDGDMGQVYRCQSGRCLHEEPLYFGGPNQSVTEAT